MNAVWPTTATDSAASDDGDHGDAGGAVHPAERDGMGQRDGQHEVAHRGRDRDEEAERQAAHQRVPERGHVPVQVHPCQPRQQGQRDRRRSHRDRQVVEVQRDLEGDDPAGQPVRHHQQGQHLQRQQSRLRQRRQRPPDDHPDLRVAPAGPRHQQHPGPPGTPPLRGRVHRDRGGRARGRAAAAHRAGRWRARCRCRRSPPSAPARRSCPGSPPPARPLPGRTAGVSSSPRWRCRPRRSRRSAGRT